MILEFGIGTCGILFGMTPKDVVSALGMPDKINVCEDDEIYGQTYIYNKDMLMVWFEREKDMRVTLIQCFSPEMTVFGQKVFLREKEEVMKLVKSAGCSRFTENDGRRRKPSSLTTLPPGSILNSASCHMWSSAYSSTKRPAKEYGASENKPENKIHSQKRADFLFSEKHSVGAHAQIFRQKKCARNFLAGA